MQRLLRCLLGLMAFAPTVLGLAEIPHRARGGSAWASASKLVSATPASLFTQLLDHTSDSSPTFQQRYFVDSQFFDASASRPLAFLNICGEGPCGGPPSPTGVIGQLAQKHNALLVSLEHRFYGDSVPGKDFSTGNLKYLSVEQALGDLAYFIDNFPNKPAGLEFYTVGGSYSGAMSAWFREAYPQTTLGSLSSSGVVNAIYEFTEFDEQVAESAGSDCADSLRAITAAFEAMFAAGNGAEAKAMFKAPAIGDDDFFYMIADSGAMAVQYGSMVKLCSALPPADSPPEKLTAAFADFTIELWGADFGSNCFYDTTCLKNDPTKWQPTSRAWRWQKCSELAYFQTAPAVNSIRSKRITLEYHLNQCQVAFGIPTLAPNTSVINAKFGGPTPSETNVFYTNGSQDPWQRAAVNHTLSDTQPELTAVCDSCGHCGDLESYANSAAVEAQRAAFTKFFEAQL